MPTPDPVQRLSVGGVGFRPTTSDRLDSAVRTALLGRAGQPALVVGFANPHVITTASVSPVVARHLDRCDHVCVDGIGVWLAALLRGVRTERLPAHRAFDRLMATNALQGRTVVIGIEPDRVEAAAKIIAASAPSIDLVKAIDGFAHDQSIVAALDKAGPVDLVIIGAGSPRSEEIAELVESGQSARVIIHAGAGTLKVHAGDRSHPPTLMGRLGLDWVYRFVFEPHTRQRYLRGLPAFARQVLQPPRSLLGGTQ